MGLFTRQPVQLKQNLPYTVSASVKTKLVVGLGNPEKKYEKTRHNFGFLAVEQYANNNNYDDWQEQTKFRALISENSFISTKVILVKPLTYMNLSGEAVQLIANYYKVNTPDILVVYDDLSLPFGHIRSRRGGQSGGHNGIKSLMNCLDNDFYRLKIGTKNSKLSNLDQSDFVLAKFTKAEESAIKAILSEVSEMINEFVFNNSITNDTRKVDIN
ncbi:aminoacyl-tRNA hydrolase [Candidatus Saccharibacteria bacterium]|jgi:PTH1 family peptidyl-tRNA hydrolase|nr:aminoacyl-tRNA hydrolase [Candidatus Saccharibacteria bacterium]HOR23379.1 aminoacyl-tRNA hydrolase [Candidatus Saccharibacteria bacterium]HPW48185.1 aminoacyl-tRNA hydrolase [Candidatus Saccharibacteria bacterium]